MRITDGQAYDLCRDLEPPAPQNPLYHEIVARGRDTIALRDENERLAMKVEQYQLQLEDRWAAHLEALEAVREKGRELAAENKALRQSLSKVIGKLMVAEGCAREL